MSGDTAKQFRFDEDGMEDSVDGSMQFEPSYDPTMYTSLIDDSMDAGLLMNDTLQSPHAYNQQPDLKRGGNGKPESRKKSYVLIRKHMQRQEKFDLSQRLREHYKEAFWNTLLIIYIILCESSIKMFNCATVDDKKYLWYAGDIECYYTSQYVFIAVFCALLLFPFYIIYALWKLRGSLSQWRRIKYAAFTMSYRSSKWYYEAVMMFRRVI